MTPCACA